jgi:hypothetical protein
MTTLFMKAINQLTDQITRTGFLKKRYKEGGGVGIELFSFFLEGIYLPYIDDDMVLQ